MLDFHSEQDNVLILEQKMKIYLVQETTVQKLKQFEKINLNIQYWGAKFRNKGQSKNHKNQAQANTTSF